MTVDPSTVQRISRPFADSAPTRLCFNQVLRMPSPLHASHRSIARIASVYCTIKNCR